MVPFLLLSVTLAPIVVSEFSAQHCSLSLVFIQAALGPWAFPVSAGLVLLIMASSSAESLLCVHTRNYTWYILQRKNKGL